MTDLPSKKIYSLLEGGPEECGAGKYTEKIRMTLKDSLGEENVKKIIKALCYINGIRGSEKAGSEEYSQGCAFLQYHVGEILSGIYSNDDSEFKNTMADVESAIEAQKGEWDNCFMYHSDKKGEFNNRKLLFDYSQDYQNIETYVPGSENQCFAQYKKYLQNAENACSGMLSQCTTTAGKNTGQKDYCKLFQQVCRGNHNPGEETIPKPSDLKSKLESLKGTTIPETRQSHSHTVTDTSPSELNIPAICGTLGTVGIAATLSFLTYKYTSLFSGIGGTLLSGGKNSRKRRFVRQDLNNFSDDDSSSTAEYATTVGSSYNLTRADSTDAASTIYNGTRPPSGRRGASNGRPGNRNNISYQRM